MNESKNKYSDPPPLAKALGHQGRLCRFLPPLPSKSNSHPASVCHMQSPPSAPTTTDPALRSLVSCSDFVYLHFNPLSHCFSHVSNPRQTIESDLTFLTLGTLPAYLYLGRYLLTHLGIKAQTPPPPQRRHASHGPSSTTTTSAF